MYIGTVPPRPEYDKRWRARSPATRRTCVITGKAKMRVVEGWSDDLFSADATRIKTVAVKAIPYALWANRKPGEMRVWLNAR